MLKQMRWRFIGAAMAAFTAVVLTLLCFVNLWNYHSMTDQQDEALSHLLEVEDQQKPFSREKDAPPLTTGRTSRRRCSIPSASSPSTMTPTAPCSG